MRRLRRYAGDPWQIYLAISEASTHELRREALTQVRDAVMRSYDDYLDVWGDASSLVESATIVVSAQADALRICYTTASPALKRLKQDIRELQDELMRRTCQNCGFNEPNTFDHYVPKEKFPEFAVHPLNLVPCCQQCNDFRRREGWRGEHGRSTFHLYLDDVEVDERHLFAEISEERGQKPRMHYACNASVDDPGFGGQYARHARTLHLSERLDGRAPTELDRICCEISATRDLLALEPGATDVVARLCRWAGNIAALRSGSLGTNHWEVATWCAVAESPGFVSWCLTRQTMEVHREQG